MTLAFLIYSYFPYGGQQRDFLRVVSECVVRGHAVTVYTMEWQGARPEGFNIMIVPARGWTNTARYRHFTALVTDLLRQHKADAVIGFNRMPGLDIHFAADPCFAERALRDRGFYYRLTPRYRHFIRYEEAVFGAQANTHALLLSPVQRRQFTQHYPGSVARLHDLPPGIARDRQPPGDVQEIRAQFRHEFGLQDDHHAIVQIGSGFKVKGVDRSLHALAALPAAVRDKSRYLLVGQDKPQQYQRLARRLGIFDNCRFIGGRHDVPRFLFGSDLLLHPAYSESAGYTLLEAVVAGLPVLTTDTCGYAFHVTTAGAGEVCESPFRQADLNQRLLHMLTAPERNAWREAGLRYGRSADLYSMPEHAVNLVEQLVSARRAA